ncbi:hypothetical protein MIND_00684700 [Mycena indigotica]|uniref:Uncharacterized protein n=1 Tax=Mycena indigotica TaxID=2126181 RepID=A0A8H6SLU5_9AGAR|nr:uncharacterized protein MIND_00684700 [Mycena indigotica]KAF7301200.1 hypothetical protein MIND_00684700 [Mycena indigotica]
MVINYPSSLSTMPTQSVPSSPIPTFIDVHAKDRRHILGILSRKVLQNTIATVAHSPKLVAQAIFPGTDENSQDAVLKENIMRRIVRKSRNHYAAKPPKASSIPPIPPPMQRVLRSIPIGAEGFVEPIHVPAIPKNSTLKPRRDDYFNLPPPLTPSENRAIMCLSASQPNNSDAQSNAMLVLSDERQTSRLQIDALSSQITALRRNEPAPDSALASQQQLTVANSSSTLATLKPNASQTSLAPPMLTHARSSGSQRETFHVVRELGPDTADEAILRVFRRKSYQEPSTQFEHGSDPTPLW